VTVGASCR